MFEDNECVDLVFIDIRDPILKSLVQLLYNGSATIGARNQAEFIGALERLEIDVLLTPKQMEPVATSPSQQSHKKKARAMSESARKAPQKSKKPLTEAEEDLREIAKAAKKFARQRSKSVAYAEPRKQISKDVDEKNDSYAHPIPKPRGRPRGKNYSVSEKQGLTPNKRKKDGIACPECEAIFKTAELVTMHFNRAHIVKRVRRQTQLY